MRIPIVGSNPVTGSERDRTGRPLQARRVVLWALVLSGAISLVAVAAGDAAAPQLVLVYGDLLPERVVLADWEENARFMDSIVSEVEESPDDLDDRHFLHLAFFWGEAWAEALAGGELPVNLAPEQANQHGKFYPATEDRVALVWLESVPGSPAGLRRVAPDGIAILKDHGVPVQVEDSARAVISFFCLIAGGGWLVLLGLAVYWLRRPLRHRPE